MKVYSISFSIVMRKIFLIFAYQLMEINRSFYVEGYIIIKVLWTCSIDHFFKYPAYVYAFF